MWINKPMTDDSTRYHSNMILITASRPLASRKPVSRFQRLAVPQDSIPPALQLTKRIIQNILSPLAMHRYLSTDQIIRLDGGSAAHIRHLLRLLHRHGLVERPAGQAAYLSSFLHQGNVALVYTITRNGMRLLAEHGHPVDPRQDWTTKNTGTGSALFLAHALQVSEFMLDCRLAMPADRELIDHHDLLPLLVGTSRAHKFPYRLVVNVQTDDKPHTFTVVPDRIFRINVPARDHHWNFLLEIDRGTESLSTRSKRSTNKATWRRKLTGYLHAYRQGKFDETWGFPNQRIVTVTTSDARIDHMLALQREITNDTAAGLFLYTTRQRIEHHGVLGCAWRSAHGDDIALMDR